MYVAITALRSVALSWALSCALFGAMSCAAPIDSNEYEYTEGDTTASAALGTACTDAGSAVGGLLCATPAVCRRTADATGHAGGRCDESVPCPERYVCESLSEVALHTRDCDDDTDCPNESQCWPHTGPAQWRCIRQGGRVGASCDKETDCAFGLFCENRAQGGYCTQRCEATLPCPQGMNAICTRLSGDYGAYCLQSCEPGDESCAPGIVCRKMTKSDAHVCFPNF